MTQRKASPETMARLCEAIDQRLRRTGAEPPHEWAAELAAYRAETTPPLRSRAEVDAEIVTEARLYWAGPRTATPLRERRLNALCAEPTAPEPAPSAEPYRVHDLRNTFTSHDQDTREERPCGCEEAEALKRSLREIRTEIGIWSDCHKSATATISAIALILRGEP
jgi:hypothetical protein